MDVLNIVLQIITKENIIGFALFLLLADKIKLLDKIKKFKKSDHPKRRESDNEDIIHYTQSYRDEFVELKKMFQAHMEDEGKENVRIGIMETRLDHAEESQERLEKNDGDIFRLLSDIKSLMIQNKGN